MKKNGELNMIFDCEIPYDDEKFLKIIDFYLFRCPVPERSVRGKSFAEYGIQGHVAFAKLKKNMFERSANLNSKSYFPSKKSDVQRNVFLVNDLSPNREYCVFYQHDEDTKMQSLFSSIRDSLAHGRFAIRGVGEQKIYYMQNYYNFLRAEIRLYERTLINWIEIIESFNQN